MGGKAKASPESSMGSSSTVFLTWSDSPVKALSSIFRSFPWIRIPSAGKRSPGEKEGGGRKRKWRMIVRDKRRMWEGMVLFSSSAPPMEAS